MTLSRSLCALSALLLLAQARRLPAYRHEAFELEVRQAEPTDVSALATQAGVLTIITPSPGAVPVSVTEQSQIVTTYIPQFTLCDLPPVGFFPVTRPTTLPSNAPFRNISMTIPPGTGSCETIYKTTATMVCATTLSDLTTTYTISKCPQDVTFSTQYGYVIATPTATANLTGNSPTGTYGNGSAMITAAPSIRTLTTFFLAPWQQLTTAGPPEDVDLKVCATLANGTVNCVREYQIWKTSLLTINATSTISVNFSTTIAGPSQLIVETFVANITKALVTYSMSTTMELEYVTEALTTETASRAVSTEPTVYQTKTVERASAEVTSTITRRITSTILGGTTTITLSKSLPTVEAPEATDAAENEGEDEGEEVVEQADDEAEEAEEDEEDEPMTGVAVPKPTTTSYANFASILGADGYRH